MPSSEFSCQPPFAQIESGKWLGKVYAPVNGELAENNQALESNPALINEDCYGEGWMFKIRASNMSELNDLMHGAEAAKEWLLAEIEKHAKD